MSLTYTQLSNRLNESELSCKEMQKEMDDLYEWVAELQDEAKVDARRIIQLEVLNGSLDKRLLRGKYQ